MVQSGKLGRELVAVVAALFHPWSTMGRARVRGREWFHSHRTGLPSPFCTDRPASTLLPLFSVAKPKKTSLALSTVAKKVDTVSPLGSWGLVLTAHLA